jgi:hypothetical protein
MSLTFLNTKQMWAREATVLTICWTAWKETNNPFQVNYQAWFNIKKSAFCYNIRLKPTNLELKQKKSNAGLDRQLNCQINIIQGKLVLCLIDSSIQNTTF